MANVENRAAEHGGEIITDAVSHTWITGRQPCCIRILEDTIISSIASDTMVGIGYYTTAGTLTVDTPTILANIQELTLASGAVQVIFS
jgi:hypothetical protein